MKLLCAILIVLNFFLGENALAKYSSIEEYFSVANTITIYKDGLKTEYEKDSDEFGEILLSLNSITIGAREMPAYGVSLHEETIKEMQSGYWVELNFNKTKTYSEMPFDSLLIKVEKEWLGFDIIRGQKGVYEGRCFHLYSPTTTMENLYNTILKM